MWSSGRSLGLSSEEFWALTYREFAALMDRAHEREQREWARSGMLASVIANCNRDPDKRSDPFTAADFIPAAFCPPQPEAAEPGEKTPEEWLAIARVVNAKLGGTDLTVAE